MCFRQNPFYTAKEEGAGMNEVQFMDRVGGNLRLLRQMHGLTQRELAERLQISRSTYATIEKGEKTPSLFVGFALAAIYNIPVESLYKTDLSAAMRKLIL